MDKIKPDLKLIEGTASDAFYNDLNLFLQTDNKLIKTIFSSLKLEPSTKINDELKELSKQISLDLYTLETIFKVGDLIFTKLEKKEISLEDIRNDYKKMEVKTENFEKTKALYEDFGKKYATNILNYKTIRKVLYSLSPGIIQISYELDIRIIESENTEKLEVINKIPVARIEFKTTSRKQEFDISKFTFDATLEDLQKTIDELNKIKIKLSGLQK